MIDKIFAATWKAPAATGYAGEIQRTVVFVTHDLDEALMLGHRVAIMKDGEIVQLGNPEQILREPATEYVERFVEDVDYGKVRTAQSVMRTDADRESLARECLDLLSQLA